MQEAVTLVQMQVQEISTVRSKMPSEAKSAWQKRAYHSLKLNNLRAAREYSKAIIDVAAIHQGQATNRSLSGRLRFQIEYGNSSKLHGCIGSHSKTRNLLVALTIKLTITVVEYELGQGDEERAQMRCGMACASRLTEEPLQSPIDEVKRQTGIKRFNVKGNQHSSRGKPDSM
jgi:hypothetical protein